MKQLELSAEKAVEREEKLKDKILSIQQKFKSAEGRLTIKLSQVQSLVGTHMVISCSQMVRSHSMFSSYAHFSQFLYQ